MSFRDHLDQHSQLFCHTWTRRKHASSSQVNGETRKSQAEIILAKNAKAHRW
ncbi:MULTISPECIES: YpzG family protein [Robertmurraya]|uniref:YpzG family protein n=1 Tax=Robertmurraya beringensis TaxID=641660 RepID=A0ABV6KL65_9BACI|nr:MULTISPECIES: YpzG family protein [Bacillaceae]AYA74187.1 YpzG family protein [Bacillus sp. Y1]MCM3603270.1 YpzG family protein [Robertmurraya korlensis]